MPSIKETVAERVGALGPAVQEGVVTVLVDQEKEKRVKAILGAMNLISDTQKELKKIKPDATFDKDNKLVAETYSKTNMESKKKLEEKITKVEAALALATNPDAPDFKKLFEVMQNKGGQPAAAPVEDAAE
jgi:superfamily II DNA/RNA helicase